jgi:pre-mRNA branch site protein p14
LLSEDDTCTSSRDALDEFYTDGLCRQVRQGIANNTKGTAFVVYEDVTDAKQACDKLNGFNFQNRYLVGMSPLSVPADVVASHHQGQDAVLDLDLY